MAVTDLFNVSNCAIDENGDLKYELEKLISKKTKIIPDYINVDFDEFIAPLKEIISFHNTGKSKIVSRKK